MNNNFKFEKSAELAKKLAAASGHNTGAPGQSWAGRGGAAPSIMEEFPSLPGAPKVKIKDLISYVSVSVSFRSGTGSVDPFRNMTNPNLTFFFSIFCYVSFGRIRIHFMKTLNGSGMDPGST